jgi:phage tail tape-measure protein
MKTSESINELGAALALAQAEMGHAAKDAVNPHFRSKYANLASIIDACRGALTKNAIAVIQSPAMDRENRTVSVTTRLVHSSGQWVEGELEAEVAKTDPQAIGSAITYLRRYGLAALTSVASDDDDGAAAVAPPARPRPGSAPVDADPTSALRAKVKEWGAAIRADYPHRVPQLEELARQFGRPDTLDTTQLEQLIAKLDALYAGADQ